MQALKTIKIKLKIINLFGCLKTKELVLIDFLQSHRMLYLFAERSNVNKVSTLITLSFALGINLKQFIFTRRGNDSCLKETTDVKVGWAEYTASTASAAHPLLTSQTITNFERALRLSHWLLYFGCTKIHFHSKHSSVYLNAEHAAYARRQHIQCWRAHSIPVHSPIRGLSPYWLATWPLFFQAVLPGTEKRFKNFLINTDIWAKTSLHNILVPCPLLFHNTIQPGAPAETLSSAM